MLQRSTPAGPAEHHAVPVSRRATGRRWLLVFRDTELSDRIGFKYQNYEGEEAAEDFVRSILAMAPAQG